MSIYSNKTRLQYRPIEFSLFLLKNQSQKLDECNISKRTYIRSMYPHCCICFNTLENLAPAPTPTPAPRLYGFPYSHSVKRNMVVHQNIRYLQQYPCFCFTLVYRVPMTYYTIVYTEIYTLCIYIFFLVKLLTFFEYIESAVTVTYTSINHVRHQPPYIHTLQNILMGRSLSELFFALSFALFTLFSSHFPGKRE